jgi:hypothetical protein
MEDGLMLLGPITKKKVSQLDGYTIQHHGANHTVWLLVIITPQEDINHVELFKKLQSVNGNVSLDIQPNIKRIFIMPNKSMLFQRKLNKFRLKS